MCDLLGVDPPTDRPIDGISILVTLYSRYCEVVDWNISIAWAFKLHGDPHIAALLRGRYKFFANYNGGRIACQGTIL